MEQFRSISIELDKKLSKKEKQDNGIFFTPRKGRDFIIDYLKTINFKPEKILEPSFGSGEFLQDMRNLYKDAKIYGIELNKTLFDEVNKNIRDKNLNLFNECFLSYKDEPVDLIIGNPPYFVTNIKNNKCMSGRGNIFVIFLYKCLTEHLKNNGILAFVLPTSFYNCSYYELCRKYIKNNTIILHIENIDVKYLGTTQKTMILILKKCVSTENNFILDINDNIYITPFYKELLNITENTTSISKLGLKVKTGSIVWNQNKDKLVNDNKHTLLIYSSNIVNEELILDNLQGNEKKQYIRNISKPLDKGPCILVSRGYGNSYSFNYVLIEDEIEFYGENHVNIIYSYDLDKKILIKKLKIILNSFKNPKTNDFIKYFVGNGALSKTEIEKILPIF